MVAAAVAWAVPAVAQELPSCDDPLVFEAAATGVTEAHQKSTFGGLGGERKIVQVLGDLRPPATNDERAALMAAAEFLAVRAGYGVENVRGCYTAEWSFQRRAAVFIMRSPTNPEEWGLFMYNVALDLPVATGWILEAEEGEAPETSD